MSKRKAAAETVYAVAIQYNKDDYKDRGGGWSSLGDIRLFKTKTAAEAYILEEKKKFIEEEKDNGQSVDETLSIDKQFDKLNKGEFVPTRRDIYLEEKEIE